MSRRETYFITNMQFILTVLLIIKLAIKKSINKVKIKSFSQIKKKRDSHTKKSFTIFLLKLHKSVTKLGKKQDIFFF